jgi:hypothetical protein
VKHSCVFLLFAFGVATAAEITIPDACDDKICLTGLHWKKGTVEHTLTGFVAPKQGHIESVDLLFTYADTKHHGDIRVRLKDLQSRMNLPPEVRQTVKTLLAVR